ncbi:MAG: HAD family hydrolase [Mycoplasmataceae bacterium]|nr:HAD family hydrolase [Mycoplasmataceae bacterium]
MKSQKLFIIDINPGNDEITKDLVIGRLSKIVKNVSLYQNVVFLAHSNLSLVKKMIKDIGIKNGYAVSDGGARIYNIAKDQVVYDNSMNRDAVLAVVHYAIMQNSLVLLSSSHREYAYSMNLLNASSLNKKHYLPLPYTNNYQKLVKFINSTVIHSILIYQKERNKMLKVLDIFNSILKDWSFVAIPGQHSYFLVTNKDDTKYNTVLKIMEMLNIINVDDVYYYALNTINNQCVKAFKNHLIHQDTALISDYYNKISVQANTDNMIANIRHVFFHTDEFVNNTYITKEIINTKRLNQIMNEAHNTKKVS